MQAAKTISSGHPGWGARGNFFSSLPPVFKDIPHDEHENQARTRCGKATGNSWLSA
jgi:hypothetical protein